MNCEGYFASQRVWFFGFCLIVISKPCSCMTYHIRFSTWYRHVCDSMQEWHFLHCTVFIFFSFLGLRFLLQFPQTCQRFSVFSNNQHSVCWEWWWLTPTRCLRCLRFSRWQKRCQRNVISLLQFSDADEDWLFLMGDAERASCLNSKLKSTRACKSWFTTCVISQT